MADTAAPKTITLPTPSATTILLAVVILFLGYREFQDRSSPVAATVSGKSLALKEYSNLLEARAQALDAARIKLGSGGTLDDAQTAAEAAFDSASKQLFMQEVWPALAPLFPTGDGDATPAQKAAISKVFADESAYLRKWK